MVRSGHRLVGVRANTDHVSQALQHGLRSHLSEGPQVLPTYSVRIEDQAEPGAQALHALYQGCTALARSRDPAHIVDTLRFSLGYDRLDVSAGSRLTVRAQVLAKDREVVLLPHRLAPAPGGLERRLLGSAYARLATRTVRIDLDAADVVIPEPLSWEHEAGNTVWGVASSHPVVGPPPSGHHHIRGWIFDVDHELPSRAWALLEALRLVDDLADHDRQRAMTALATVLQDAEVAITPFGDPSPAINQARRMLAQGP